MQLLEEDIFNQDHNNDAATLSKKESEINTHANDGDREITISKVKLEKVLFKLPKVNLNNQFQANQQGNLIEVDNNPNDPANIVGCISAIYNVDFVVLETGLGGRFDSTNVISHNLCSVIVHIDFDHVERLGDTIEKIATEKAGIIKENAPCFVNSNNLGLDVLRKKALSCNSELNIVEPLNDNSLILKYSALKGVYQKENLALVDAVISYLNTQGIVIEQKDIETGLKTVQHPCRFQYNKDLNLIVDGGHNPNGIEGLRKSLDKYYPNEKSIFKNKINKNNEF